MAASLTLGRYTLHAELAAGGMATVYIGRLNGPVGFARTVAIKRLHPQFAKDVEFVNMFLDEARLAARIQHPNVVPTLDVVAEGGELFLVLDFVQGESLSGLQRAVLAAGGKMPPLVVASVIVGALRGLEAAHEARDERGEPLGIVHRDVSPQNVMVGADGVARVLDFGVAKARARLATTRDGHLKGKIAYMAPEQLTGEATRRSDVYAVGVVLWEMLAGRRLFAGDSEMQVMAMVERGATSPPSAFVEGVPPELDRICMKALARAPEDRYRSAYEMARDLDRNVDAASPMRVSEWMSEVAGAVLEERAKLVREVESGLATKPGVLEAFASAASSMQSAAANAPTVTAGEAATQVIATVSTVAKVADRAMRDAAAKAARDVAAFAGALNKGPSKGAFRRAFFPSAESKKEEERPSTPPAEEATKSERPPKK